MGVPIAGMLRDRPNLILSRKHFCGSFGLLRVWMGRSHRATLRRNARRNVVLRVFGVLGVFFSGAHELRNYRHRWTLTQLQVARNQDCFSNIYYPIA